MICNQGMVSVRQVSASLGGMQSGMKEHLSRLDEIFAARGDFIQTVKVMQQMMESVTKQLLGLPDWKEAKVDLTAIADQMGSLEYYR